MLNWGEEKFRKHLEVKTNLMRKPKETDPDGETIPCRAGLSTFWVTWDGKMSPCGMITTPIFEIRNFNDAWSCIKNSRKKIFLPSECLDCELRNYCDMCAAVPLAETGEFGKVPEYACKKAAHYKQLCNRFIRKQ